MSLLSNRHVGDADWARRLLCYQLRICLQELSENLMGATPVDVGWLMARCAELTDEAERMG